MRLDEMYQTLGVGPHGDTCSNLILSGPTKWEAFMSECVWRRKMIRLVLLLTFLLCNCTHLSDIPYQQHRFERCCTPCYGEKESCSSAAAYAGTETGRHMLETRCLDALRECVLRCAGRFPGGMGVPSVESWDWSKGWIGQ